MSAVPSGNFWFNTKTNAVEEGQQSPVVDLIGPFPTREEAARAYAIIAARNKKYDEDDSH